MTPEDRTSARLVADCRAVRFPMHTTTAPTYEHDLIAADEAEVELQQACWNNGLWLADLNSDQRTRLPIFREAVRLGLFTDEVARP